MNRKVSVMKRNISVTSTRNAAVVVVVFSSSELQNVNAFPEVLAHARDMATAAAGQGSPGEVHLHASELDKPASLSTLLCGFLPTQSVPQHKMSTLIGDGPRPTPTTRHVDQPWQQENHLNCLRDLH